jgi:hypothetical protein
MVQMIFYKRKFAKLTSRTFISYVNKVPAIIIFDRLFSKPDIGICIKNIKNLTPSKTGHSFVRLSPASEASREVENFDWRKKHTRPYMVSRNS